MVGVFVAFIRVVCGRMIYMSLPMLFFFYQHGHSVFFFFFFFFFFSRVGGGDVYDQLGHFDISQLAFYHWPLRTSIEPKSTRSSLFFACVFSHAYFRTFSCKKRK